MKKLLLTVLIVLCATQAFSQTTYTVSSNATNSGTSWTTIKAAITAASSGDIIQVAAGTFTEKNITLNAVKSLTIKGAGMGQTIIQAAAVANSTPAASCAVFNLDGAYNTAGVVLTLQDMTIQNGYNTSGGGGIRLNNTGTAAPNLNLVNLKIANNLAISGGGVYVATGPVVLSITGCNISSNSSGTGGFGGGVYLGPTTIYALSASIKNSSIANNTTLGSGGGIMVICGTNGATAVTHSLILENCTVYGNSCTTAGKLGGGIDWRMAGSGQTAIPTQNMTLNYCTIVGNTSNGGTGGDGVCIENGAYQLNLMMNNSIVMGNSGSSTNQSQVGIAASSQARITNGGITNSIFGIISGGTWVTSASTHNKLDATIGNLAFDNQLSSDAVPVLKLSPSSIAKNYVLNNILTILTDQLGNFRATSPNAGATEQLTSIPTVYLTTLKNSIGQSCTISGGGTVPLNSTVTLVATPKTGFRFLNWTDANGVLSTNTSYQFTATADNTITANFALNLGVLPSMFYSYTAGTSGYFYVYSKVNDSGVYRQFKITHYVTPSTPNSTPFNCDNWRVIDSYFVTYDGSAMTQFQQILTTGENELAWKSNRVGVEEFSAGFHGDERIDLDPTNFVHFYADSVQVLPTVTIPLTPCSSFYYQQYSTIYQTGTGQRSTVPYTYVPVVGNPIDCYHDKKTVFENSGFTCYNNLKWAAQVPINNFYYGIFCVNKDVTSQGTNEYGATVMFDQSSVNRLGSDKQKIVMVNPTMGTTVTCNSFILSVPFTPIREAHILDNTVYHKYYSNFGQPTFQIGDTCSFKSTISFDYAPVQTKLGESSIGTRVNVLLSNGMLQVNGLVPTEKFKLIDMSGKLIQSGTCDLNLVPVKFNDIYILKLELKEGVKTMKIIGQ